ncbi:HAD-like domain-containing protein [Durotheca rogersii]|uniref:HAD-like domain-containing protein n=1 Tax=Durotheca rogersii TaxID=419775 RepID=UPI002220210A|nr:HAD-like domain-containing protein [Durotheca rogersii]KAI5860707.1 HAD-like domain-containing protein [Durotheca rogersii]
MRILRPRVVAPVGAASRQLCHQFSSSPLRAPLARTASVSTTTTVPFTLASSAARCRRRGSAAADRVLGPLTSSRPLSVGHEAPKQPPTFAFAFDIDGVLMHVAKPIPGAARTLAYLQQQRIPFILLTNGGGKHETERVADLSARLGVTLTTENFVQSHTPFRELVDSPGEGLRDRNVLVTGSDAARCRAIAEQYGFRRVVIPADILAAHPDIFPFDPLMRERYAATARALPPPLPEDVGAAGGGSSGGGHPLRIDAILVFDDPRDWALDIQLITDLLASRGGVLGTYSRRNGRPDLPGRGWQADGQPALYFSNPDLHWSAGYRHPRLGQGAFQAALAGVWHELTGGQAALRRTVIGKPHGRTYGFAERVLRAHRETLWASAGAGEQKLPPLRRVYMVGDNPASDVRGANEYASPHGTPWTSILVRTGVWDPDRAGAPAHQPGRIADDVAAAVAWALEREGWPAAGGAGFDALAAREG